MNSALIAFDVVARINQVDVDIRAIAREFSLQDLVSPQELLRIAGRFDFKAKLKTFFSRKVDRWLSFTGDRRRCTWRLCRFIEAQ